MKTPSLEYIISVPSACRCWRRNRPECAGLWTRCIAVCYGMLTGVG